MTELDKLIACFRQMDFRLNIDKFEDRLIAQKIVCLLQLKGVDLNYPCHLYVRGPYSPALTQDIFNNTGRISKFQTDEILDETTTIIVDRLKNIFGLSANLLEIGATYGFYNTALRYDHPASIQELKRIKPFYSSAQIALGISKAKEFLFDPSDQDLHDMKEEFKAWQDASFT